MINKREVGARIASMRRRLGDTQASFAEKLNVTPQAVSKWETGLALPDLDVLLQMSWLIKASINEILDGNDALRKIANRPFEMDEIAYFVPREERDYNAEWAREIMRAKWVERNWAVCYREGGSVAARAALAHGGLILELGTGPGGGYVPGIMRENSDAHLIVSDLCPTVVREWKRLLDRELSPPNVYYAALDNCDLPFQDASIDVVSSGGGFGNTEGDKFRALREIYRVLKPGGLYISGDGFVTQETLRSFPEEIQKTLMEKVPDIFEDFYDATVTVGFKQIDNRITRGWSTKDDESIVADLAKDLGIEIMFTSYLRICTK